MCTYNYTYKCIDEGPKIITLKMLNGLIVVNIWNGDVDEKRISGFILNIILSLIVGIYSIIK